MGRNPLVALWGGRSLSSTSVKIYSLPPGTGERVLRAPEEEGVERSFLHSAFALLLQQLQGRGWAWWRGVAGA